MRSLFWIAVLSGTTLGCSKPTPGLCCTDEADCAAAGLPDGTGCDDRLACRGHQCVAQVCSASSECDATAPYCVLNGASGLCSGDCTDDSQCPGVAQGNDDQFCVSGACAQCRTDADCSTGAPICDGGACRGCAAHAECGSHACAPDGGCATEDQIAHVAPSGVNIGDCGALAPCTLSYALALAPPRAYLVLAAGTYTSATNITLVGKQALVGIGEPHPRITRSSPGPILGLGASADIQLDGLEVSGATTSGGDQGIGVDCEDMTGAGAATLRLRNTTIAMNTAVGIYAHTCMVEATQSTFDHNRDGTQLADLRGFV